MISGVAYYPEQWDASLMPKDLDRIVKLGCDTIRIAEFGWHIMERDDGEYDFSFFDKVIEEAKKRGLKVIFGTPTATAPAWLAGRYPDVASKFRDGTVRTFGGRHTCCYSSEVYVDRSRRIVRKLAEHYRDEDAIIAWQIDNELGHEGSDVCWCEKCVAGFRKWLEKKYGDVETLNERYGTAFWSQQYNSFDEINAPNATITVHNPSLRLDWERFCSDKIRDFARMQVDVIKSVIPSAFVIHDFSGGGLSKSLDYCAVARAVDKTAYNNYPVWGGQRKPLEPNEIAFSLDYIRGLKGDNFWITEAIMGAQGHDVTGFVPRPGQAEAWAMQAVARGCDGLVFFRYRGAIKGAEQYCYGLLDADDTEGRKWREAQRFFSRFKELEGKINSPLAAEVCMIYDFDSLASFRLQRQSEMFDGESEMKKLHAAFYRLNVPVDVIPQDSCFEKYKAVIVPNMIICRPAIRERLRTFAAGGGVVVATYRTSVKDEDNNLVFGEKIPVGLTDLFGLTVDESESMWEQKGAKLKGRGSAANKSAYAGVFRERCSVTTAETLYGYDDAFYGDAAAVAKHRYGDGLAYYVGCSPDDSVLDDIAAKVCTFCHIVPCCTPAGVESVVRKGTEGSVRITINHGCEAVAFDGEVLEPYGYRIENL